MSLEFIENKVPKEVMQKYLEKKFKGAVLIKEYEKLGSGWHGTGYKIVYQLSTDEQGIDKTIILRTLRPEGFSHDFPSDRAKSFVLQHQLSKKIPKHIKSLDVCGYCDKGELVSFGDSQEFFQLVEKATGEEYFKDLERIKKEGKLTESDKEKARMLSDYLVELHKSKFASEKIENEKEKSARAESIYKRHTRDCIGDGEMLYGVLDTYPEKITWTNEKEFVKIIMLSSLFRQRIKNKKHRLSRIHGDFHQFNIMFDAEGVISDTKNSSSNEASVENVKTDHDFIILDASREMWGEPADDLTCLAINYIWYAVMQSGRFEGPFKELFDIFWKNYMSKAKDQEILEVVQLFFAFRGVVVAHPIFYADQTDETRRRMFNFIINVLKEKRFEPRKINDYLRRPRAGNRRGGIGSATPATDSDFVEGI